MKTLIRLLLQEQSDLGLQWQTVKTLQEQSDLGLHCLHMEFVGDFGVRNFRTFIVIVCNSFSHKI